MTVSTMPKLLMIHSNNNNGNARATQNLGTKIGQNPRLSIPHQKRVAFFPESIGGKLSEMIQLDETFLNLVD